MVAKIIRAFAQAYRQALANASKTGATQEAVQNTVRRAIKAITKQEARQIFGLKLETQQNMSIPIHIQHNFHLKTTTNLHTPHSSKTQVMSLDCTKKYARNCTKLALAELSHPQNDSYRKYDEAELRQDSMPKHVAVILDGNRRWLKAHGKALDYKPFFNANMLVVDLCLKWGIPTASTYVYGLRTLGRSQEANDLIFRQLQEWLQENLDGFIRKRVRIIVIGERCMLDKSLQDKIKQVEEETSNHCSLELILAVNYEGRNDIAKATRTISEMVRAGEFGPDSIDEAMIQRHLSTKMTCNPNPDLLIRTGGDLVLSNFLMWELAFTELYFTNIYGPEFSEAEFILALRSFQKREKAFDK